jgi:hypothetical protein
MLLPDFILPSRVDRVWSYSGIDSIEQCSDKKHFESYPHDITYCYNSRGFRDAEWPNNLEELKQAIWCVGDSFTVGIGSPLEYTWPQVLSTKTGQRVINISMDGASNNWIARCVNLIQKEIDPKNIIVMWSYVHRRERENQNLNSEQRRLHFDKSNNLEDLRNLESCMAMITHSKIIQLTIPGYTPTEDYQTVWQNIRGVDWPDLLPGTLSELLALPKFVQCELKEKFKLWTDLQQSIEPQLLQSKLENNFIKVNRLDLARDAHHFDLITSQWVVDQIMPRLT